MSSANAKPGKRKTAAPKAPALPKKPRKPRGMVELPAGIVLTDLTKKQWKLGRLIGWGGFGALYLGEIQIYLILIIPSLAKGLHCSILSFYASNRA